MDYELLTRVGNVIRFFVTGGYVVAGSYFVRIGFRYVADYKASVENEKGVN